MVPIMPREASLPDSGYHTLQTGEETITAANLFSIQYVRHNSEALSDISILHSLESQSSDTPIQTDPKMRTTEIYSPTAGLDKFTP